MVFNTGKGSLKCILIPSALILQNHEIQHLIVNIQARSSQIEADKKV